MNGAWRSEVQRLKDQVVVAIARFMALLVFMGMHWVLTRLTPHVLPTEWKKSKLLLDVVWFVAFLILYVDQVFEMLAAFIPKLQGLRTTLRGGHTEEGGKMP